MITRVRQYAKKEPSRDAHKLYVICEGAHDEPKYFEFFEGLSSNLSVITIPSEAGKPILCNWNVGLWKSLTLSVVAFLWIFHKGTEFGLSLTLMLGHWKVKSRFFVIFARK